MQRSDTKAKPNLYNVPNPITKARQEMGLTQEQLADDAAVAKITINHIEAGIITRIPSCVLGALTSSSSYAVALHDSYNDWCVATRKANAGYLIVGISSFIEPSCTRYGDWLVLRKSISTSKIGFCKLFCLHSQVLSNFESSWMDRESLTPGMYSNWRSCGVSAGLISDFNLALFRANKKRSRS